MKLPRFLYILIIAAFSLTACNNQNGGSKRRGESSILSVDPFADEPSIKKDATLSFSAIDNTCMVTPKVKNFIDAMKGQEKTLEYPYRLSPLYGPEDYEEMAKKEEKEDDYPYNVEDTGGVDVCEYLNRNDYANTIENVPIKNSWSKGNLNYKRAKVRFWPASDKNDIREVISTDLISAELPNLYRNTDYLYQVIADSDTTRYTSQQVKFKTADYTRVVTFGDVSNVRDLGGYMTSYGVKTKQGLIYRGGLIEENEKTQRVQDEVLHIAKEIELKNSGRKASDLYIDNSKVEYIKANVASYEDFVNDEETAKSLIKIFNALESADKKPVYLSSSNGCDEVGLVSFFINAILGVSYTDLIIDYELSTEVSNKRCHMHNSSNAHFPKFIDKFIKYGGYDASKTLNQNCEQFLIDKGVSYQTIDKVRKVMLPNYNESMKEVEPKYTPTGEYIINDLAHYKKANEDPLVKCLYHRHHMIVNENKPIEPGTTYLICTECGYENTIYDFLAMK